MDEYSYILCNIFLLELYSFSGFAEHFRYANLAQPLWPLISLPQDFTPVVAIFFKILGFSAALFAALPSSYQLFRVLHFVSIFVTIAMENSFGAIGNNKHIYLWASLFLSFIPSPKDETDTKIRKSSIFALQMYFMAQIFISIFYFLSGFWKLTALINCTFILQGQCHIDRYMMPSLLAQELIEYGQQPIGASLIMNYPFTSTSLYLGVTIFELLAPFLIIFSRYHVFFGAIAICFHIGAYIFLGVNFLISVPTIFILYVLSPYKNFHKESEVFLKRFKNL